ncbi:MAG: 30S ribosomal protein S5 [Minisyncoccia bacterium]
MTENNTQNNNGKGVSAPVPAAAAQGQGVGRPFAPRQGGPRAGFNDRGGNRGGGKGGRGKGGRAERPRSEFDSKILNIRRVTRVASGGRRFNFSVAIAIGDHKGKVGIGLGKAGDTAAAIDKATRDAKKNMITVATTKTMSIPHEVSTKYSSARIIIIPAPGRGVVAGSATRVVIELAGLKDITTKILSGSKNKLNIARATIQALSSFKKTFKSPTEVKAPAPVKEITK